MRQIILSVLFILIFSSFAVANIINVPADYSSIQEGINASSDGDTILVQPGNYIENINYNGKSIIVGSLFLTTQDTSFISQTVIDGNQNGSVVTFENGENAESVLRGISLINGNGNIFFGNRSGGGIFCNNSDPNLLNLIIYNNSVELNGGGIYCISSSPNIENVGISCNSAGNQGGGICCYDYSSPTLVNVTISCNFSQFSGGGISCLAHSNPSLENVFISDNTASDWGGGVYCDYYCYPTFSNVTITENHAYGGGGIHFFYHCNAVFDSNNRCNIYSNFADCANDISNVYCQTINLVVDTFTVLNPTDFYAHPVENFTFDILNGKVQQVDSDLYVSPDGSNSNNGLSFDEPLKTIHYAYSIIEVNNSNYHSIYLAPGTYSQSNNGEHFPVNCINYVSLMGSGENVTILDANFEKGVLLFVQANEVTVKGISVTNGFSNNGGIACGMYSSPNLINMKIFNNTAEGDEGDGGGFICVNNCNPVLKNVEITENTASDKGGGIYCGWNSNLTLINVTISNNSAVEGGGIYIENSSSMIIVNSILWNDSPNEIHGSANAFYSDIQGGWTGEGNINIDPFFVDPDNGDFHLQDNSTCIDAGTAYFEWQGDIIVDLSPDEYIGIAPDMGAYEFGMQGIIDDTQIPVNKIVIQNYPNPFNPQTTISFSLSRNYNNVKLNIYNIKGELVRNLINNKVMNSGKNFIQWDGKNNKGKEVSTNVYLYTLRVGDKVVTKKMLLVR